MILSAFIVLMQIKKGILQVPLDLDCGITSKLVLNSVTIVPLLNSSCVLIASSLRLDETTDVPFAQLLRTLNRMEMISGLEVENTALRNLSFLSDYVVISVSKTDSYEIRIANNSKLEAMPLFRFNPNLYVVNNPLLTFDCVQVEGYDYARRRIRGNKENCGCELDGPLTETDALKLDDNCSAIYGNFELAEKGPPTYNTLMMKFGNATKFIGEILITRSEYQDLEFFGNLRTISVIYDIHGKFEEKFLRVQSNLKLQRLGLNMLQNVVLATVEISDNPNLCVRPGELKSLITTEYVSKIHAHICQGEYEEGLCQIGNDSYLADVPAGCEELIGRLTLNQATNTSELWKLYNITTIYGQLTIINASIIGLSSLWKLKRIVNLSPNGSALAIKSNPHLASVYFNDIDRIVSSRPIQILNNSVMELSDADCSDLNKSAAVTSSGNLRNCPDLAKTSSCLVELSSYSGTSMVAVIISSKLLLRLDR